MVVCDAMRENTIDDNINAIGVSHQPAEMNGWPHSTFDWFFFPLWPKTLNIDWHLLLLESATLFQLAFPSDVQVSSSIPIMNAQDLINISAISYFVHCYVLNQSDLLIQWRMSGVSRWSRFPSKFNCVATIKIVLISTSLFILVTSNIEEDMKLESAMGGGGLLVNREKEAQEREREKKKEERKREGEKMGQSNASVLTAPYIGWWMRNVRRRRRRRWRRFLAAVSNGCHGRSQISCDHGPALNNNRDSCWFS